MLFRTMVGRKIIMSLTGLLLICFAVIHLLGSSSLFIGPDGINAYAQMLHSFGPVVWIVRIILLIIISLHAYFGILLYLENRNAKPEKYAIQRRLSTKLASRVMIWTGILIGIYLVFHLLHFTFYIINPGASAGQNLDAAYRPDVYNMIVLGFSNALTAGFYIFSISALGFHLSHGIQSMFQTLGLNNENTLSMMIRIGTAAAIVFFLGYASIPASIFIGIVGR